MHEAYTLFPVITSFPLKIEAVTGYDNNVIVGTQQGHLLMYSIQSQNDPNGKVTLLRSNKNFSRKPITQVAVVPEHQIIVSLSDNVISVHDLTIFNFPLLTLMSETKGATAFDIDIKVHTSLTGETKATVRLVVAVRRKIQLYYWKARQFQSLRDELSLPDTPRLVTWCGEAIAVAFKNEYWLVKLTGDQKELFPTGRNQEPTITRIGNNRLGLGRDDKTVFVDCEGKTSCNYTLEWSEQPMAIVYDEPFLIGLLPKSLEIQTQDPKVTIQNIPLEKPNILAIARSRNNDNRSQIYVASSSYVRCLQFMPIHHQLPSLLAQHQFQLALQLVDLCKESTQEKAQSKLHIEKLNAFNLFCNGKYHEAIEMFFDLNAELLFVIGLYPGLVPDELCSRMQYPSKVPLLSGSQLEKALQALIHFLLKIRRKLVRAEDVEVINDAVNNKQRMMQIVDTTLLKCYLKTNDTLVPSLLRMPDSKVSVEEGERVLRQSNKLPELVLLLQTKGLHHRALQLLHRHSKKSESKLFGTSNTVDYLQTLGHEDMDIVFEYSNWVIKENPEDGLKIFTGDDVLFSDVERIPRQRIFNHLKKFHQNLVVPYLEHVIWEWGDTDPVLHNELVHNYRDLVMAPLPSPDSDPQLIEQKKKLKNETRDKLLSFLKTSNHYNGATMLAHFPHDCLYEERALMLGRIGQHQQSLNIYINVLNNLEEALEHCRIHYNPNDRGSDVYLTLLKLLVLPIKTDETDSNPRKELLNSKSSVILDLLQNFSHCFDLEQTIEVLPDNLPLDKLQSFLHSSLNGSLVSHHRKQIERGLSKSILGETQKKYLYEKKGHITISENTHCSVCRKRFTKHSAFSWYPNGSIAHFSCQKSLDKVT